MGNERKDTHKLALGSVLGAAAVVLLLLSCMLPTMQLTVIAIAGLLSAVMLIESGVKWAVMVYVAVTVLSILLLPDKSSALFYGMFFGHYPIAKYELERIRKPVLCWLAKLAVGNLCIAGVFLILQVFFPEWEMEYALWLIWLLCEATFVLFDIAMTKLVGYYQFRIRPKLVHRR